MLDRLALDISSTCCIAAEQVEILGSTNKLRRTCITTATRVLGDGLAAEQQETESFEESCHDEFRSHFGKPPGLEEKTQREF